jgi:hypothetical protein
MTTLHGQCRGSTCQQGKRGSVPLPVGFQFPLVGFFWGRLSMSSWEASLERRDTASMGGREATSDPRGAAKYS